MAFHTGKLLPGAVAVMESSVTAQVAANRQYTCNFATASSLAVGLKETK